MKMPERSQILQSVDQFQKRDPELHRELWRKAAEPVDDEAGSQLLERPRRFSRSTRPCRLRKKYARGTRAHRGGGDSASRLWCGRARRSATGR